jgi:thiosulfate/3-mercaptopyruvate sulfurtransferase
MAAIHGDHSVIIDARDPEHYAGRESLTERKGHIPKSINMPWYEFVQNRDAEDVFDRLTEPTRFEESEALQDRLSELPRDKKIVLYCNGGQESAVVYFALKSLGIESAIYDGSWFEWSADSKLPVELE